MAEPVFEMLWDCAYCGTRKLLGKTHRFCPKCGAPQDPERRYFPSEEEKVAALDHVYAGADRVCANCNSAMSARAAHCTQCGAPLEGALEVRRVADAGDAPAPSRAGAAAAQPARSKAGCLLPAIGLATLLAGGFLGALFWTRDEMARVTGVSWERSIVVEAFGPTRGSAWCDSVPSGAYAISRRREIRSHRQVAAGEDCKTVNVDRGDGTFSQRRECTPRYREEPVYDQRCEYTVDRWAESRRAVASGEAQAPVAHWPQLALRLGECRGCEREGTRQASYKVVLQAGERRFVCDVSEREWPTFEPGSRWAFKVGVVLGSPDCKSMRRVSGS